MSYLSTLIRYEEMLAQSPDGARATPREYHDDIVDHLVDNLKQLEKEQIFNRIQIFQRDRQCVFDSKKDSQAAAEILASLLFGQWSNFDKEMLDIGRKQLEKLKIRNQER